MDWIISWYWKAWNEYQNGFDTAENDYKKSPTESLSSNKNSKSWHFLSNIVDYTPKSVIIYYDSLLASSVHYIKISYNSQKCEEIWHVKIPALLYEL